MIHLIFLISQWGDTDWPGWAEWFEQNRVERKNRARPDSTFSLLLSLTPDCCHFTRGSHQKTPVFWAHFLVPALWRLLGHLSFSFYLYFPTHFPSWKAAVMARNAAAILHVYETQSQSIKTLSWKEFLLQLPTGWCESCRPRFLHVGGYEPQSQSSPRVFISFPPPPARLTDSNNRNSARTFCLIYFLPAYTAVKIVLVVLLLSILKKYSAYTKTGTAVQLMPVRFPFNLMDFAVFLTDLVCGG